MKISMVLVALLGAAAALPVLAEQDATPAVKADPAKAQQIATQVCAGCHGPDGNSMIPTNPNLAGQHAEYITKQLRNFKAADGKPAERNNPIMGGMVAALTPEDMVNLGAYFAKQTPKPGTAKDKALAEQGQKLYRGGNAATGVPACAACHSPSGAGIPIRYPRLAGQHPDYTLAQLKAFRAEERANDANKMMRTVAAKMSDQEMKAVAEYIAGLH